MTSLACRLGSGAGFAGDRVDAAVRMVAAGEVDAIALECLAERTLLPALKMRAADPNAGYDPRLRRRLKPLLPVAHAQGCKVLSNLGQANPVAAGQAIARLASEEGVGGLRVAAIHGDDVMALADEIAWDRPIDGRLVGAHAYLGAMPLAQALDLGADVVVTGRVADSALFAAATVARLDVGEAAFAGALTVGHLLECSGQLSGGNFEPIGGQLLSAADYAGLGFPLAHVMSDGSAVIGLARGEPGRIDPQTCTLQLLYEVHDPSRYATPDLVLDFSAVSFETVGPNQVRVSGARSHGAPPTLKVAGYLERPGVVADMEIGFAGTRALERAQRAADVLRLRLGDWAASDLQIDLVGVNAVLKSGALPLQAPPAELRVHVSARCADLDAAQIVEDEVYALTLSGPAGGCCVRSERRARIEVLDGYIPASRVRTTIEWSTS